MNEAGHAEVRELLGVHALGLLEGPERVRLEEHLSGCAGCRGELAGLRPLGPALDRVDPDLPEGELTLPDSVGSWLRDRVAAERAGLAAPDHPEPASRPGPGPRRARVLLAAAAVAAVLLAGLVGYRLAPAPPAVAMEPVAVSTTGADPDVRASASLIAHTWGVEVRLEASGFDAGESYRVQVQGRDGRTVSAGEFVGTGTDPMVCNLNSSLLRPAATGFAVLDEDGETVLSSRF